jgi:hypothetical protein
VIEERNEERRKKIGHHGYTKTLFSTHLVLLERSQRNGSNYTLEKH